MKPYCTVCYIVMCSGRLYWLAFKDQNTYSISLLVLASTLNNFVFLGNQEQQFHHSYHKMA